MTHDQLSLDLTYSLDSHADSDQDGRSSKWNPHMLPY